MSRSSGSTSAKATTADLSPPQIDEMPAIPHQVLYAGLPFYSDPECTREVPQARLVILQSLDPDDPVNELDVLPSLKRYQAGQIVQWNLNNKRIWEACWYRDPETGQIEKAWNVHVEFIGAVLSQKALAENAARLQELTRRIKLPKPPVVN